MRLRHIALIVFLSALAIDIGCSVRHFRECRAHGFSVLYCAGI